MGSFYIPKTGVETVLDHIREENENVLRKMSARMNAAIHIVFATARTKRGMISVIEKMTITGKFKGRQKGIRRVSDPKAKFGVPVQTGALRASIEKRVDAGRDRIVGRVFTRSPIAHFIEFGTVKMAPRPFMRPALYENAEEIKKIFGVNA